MAEFLIKRFKDYVRDHGVEVGDLAGAAASYAAAAQRQAAEMFMDDALLNPFVKNPTAINPQQTFRFPHSFWQPHADPVENMLMAQELIMMEIETVRRHRIRND